MHYTNPILYGDYSDPDVIRVGEDFYMISSSFTYVPGIPVLHSRDLVHWEIVGYAAQRLPFARYDRPAHKCGTWAPSLRYHQGLFYVYVCLPDEGLFAFTAADPAGEWICHYVKDVTGWIDPCPLFDGDGRTWLVHGFAASRAGINNVLYVHEMSADGLKVLDKGRRVYDGAEHGDITVEGPKFYRRDGKYWILCPAGGVAAGYQLALRADSVFGPYERRVVLRQGEKIPRNDTGDGIFPEVNGPHQGGWFDDGRGGDWFIHFQDVGVYGRIPHLQPVDWSDGWPVMGQGGFPVTGGETPFAPFAGDIPDEDRFEKGLSLTWQWQANPDEAWYTERKPGLRLHAAPAENPFHAGNFLSRLMPCRNFDMDVQMSLCLQAGDEAGTAMMGYTWHALVLREGRLLLRRGDVKEISRWERERVTETVLAETAWDGSEICFRMAVREGSVSFYYGKDPECLKPLGEAVPMTCGGWTGARPGFFCLNTAGSRGGYADVKRVSITRKNAGM